LLIFSYNIAQFAVLLFFWPVLLVLMAAKPKYRTRLPARLGRGLSTLRRPGNRAGQTFWIHALSVGEITSAVPLITGIRERYSDSRIIITTATTAGEHIAHTLLGATADHILASPLDLLPVVERYLRIIRPDTFILVETDFWPNLMAGLARHTVPTLLVNGRISQKSFAAYKKHAWFFLPMFGRFDRICLQTEEEKTKFRDIGVDPQKLHTLGNLKYDLVEHAASAGEISRLLPENRLLFIAGSTHPGEEELLFSAYQQLRQEHPELYLILVPRKPERAGAILELGQRFNLHGARRTDNSQCPDDYLLVDTIGELVELYRHSDIAFTGGSLVAAGGHNPVEPARMGLPVLFGPHMEDFQEIAGEFVASGGGRTVADLHELTTVLGELVNNNFLRQQMGKAAREVVISRQGVVARHLDIIDSLLS